MSSDENFPTEVETIIIGGGIIGCSIAYHLSKKRNARYLSLGKKTTDMWNNMACSWSCKHVMANTHSYKLSQILSLNYTHH